MDKKVFNPNQTAALLLQALLQHQRNSGILKTVIFSQPKRTSLIQQRLVEGSQQSNISSSTLLPPPNCPICHQDVYEDILFIG